MPNPPLCQVDEACTYPATVITVAVNSTVPPSRAHAPTALSCEAHIPAARADVDHWSGNGVMTLRLAPTPNVESREIVVARDGEDEITEIRCPWECGSSEFLLLDQSKVRENRLVLGEGGWVEVWEDRNGRDLHTIGYCCAACRLPVDLPADIDPVW